MVALRIGQRTATDTFQEASRAARGEYGRLFRSPAQGERPSLAPASPLEGSTTLSTSGRRSLPPRFESPDPLPHTSESTVDCSLHRPAASASGAGRWAKLAQIIPMVASNEATAKDAAAGGCGDAQDVRVDYGCRAGYSFRRLVGLWI